jgi:general stress protein YciG
VNRGQRGGRKFGGSSKHDTQRLSHLSGNLQKPT